MTEKEFRKLRSLDLIQILLTQGNEEARLQEELDKQKEHLAGLRERNDNLKIELNDKDTLIETLKQDLNRSDAEIRDLREELKALYTDKRIDLENIGSLTEVAQRVNHIFEMAQREAEEYLAHPERVQAMPMNTGSDEVSINRQLTVIDSVDTDDIKVEVAEKKFAAEATETSETAIFETSDSPIKTASDEIPENADEVIFENTTADVTDNPIEPIADDITEHPAGSIGIDTADHSAEIITAEAAEHNPNNIEEVVTAIAEEAVADTVTAEIAEHEAEIAAHGADLTDATDIPDEIQPVEVHTSEADSPEINSTTESNVDEAKTNLETSPVENTEPAVSELITEKIESNVPITDAKQEPQHHITTPKKTHSNKNWFRRLIGGAKREKSGR